jgi:uncharacterized protein (DUF1800 family)
MKTGESSLRRVFCLAFFSVWVFSFGAAQDAVGASTLTASFVGVGADVVSQTSVSPDGQPDFHITLGGLRSAPAQITVTADTGGIWNFPFNGINWVVGLFNYNAASGELYFAQFPSNKFRVQVGYADGSFDEADAVNRPPPPSTLTANFIGVGADVVGIPVLSPDGQPDFHISLGGLRSAPTQITVTSDTGGVWNFPFDNYHWVVGLFNYSGASGELYFAQFPSNKFHVQVWYSDGTSDQADALNQPPSTSTLTAKFVGVGTDLVGIPVLSPDGQPDFHITLGGLRSAPTRITVTSDTAGIWNFPFNGINWVVGLFNYSGATGELYFAQFASNTFHVQVWYSDGTSDQTDATNAIGPTQFDTVRLLEQSTFGPTNALIAHVQQVSFEGFLAEQFAAAPSNYPDLPFWPQTRPTTCTNTAPSTCQRDNYTFYQLQKQFYVNALSGQDQLRQRLAFALSQIMVTSASDVPLPSWMRSYQQLLYSSAFGNFRRLLYDVTLHPTMGRFLDMLNNRCQTRTPINVNICRNGLSSQPNENYAREVLQLFSIGTFLLNQNGSRQLDGSGNPIPTYDQTTVEEFARVFTGWVLAPNLPGPPESGATTVPNYRDPMVQHKDSSAREDYHDRGTKTLLNAVQLPAGMTADQDLNAAIDNIAYHPNVAPFICKQLIQHLVTSNPSPAYVQRIAAVFTANQTSDTQLFQVVRAILLDSEARGDVKDSTTLPDYGKLREPAQFIPNVLRAFGAASDGVLNSLNVGGSAIGSADMNEDLFNAPSVFNFFPPTARVPGETVLGPEFALFSSLTSLRRANFVNRAILSTIANSGGLVGIPAAPPDRPLGTSINLSAWDSLAVNPDQLIDALNLLLLHGAISPEMRQSIKNAVSSVAVSNRRLRVQTAIYLILTSSQYQVQR